MKRQHEEPDEDLSHEDEQNAKKLRIDDDEPKEGSNIEKTTLNAPEEEDGAARPEPTELEIKEAGNTEVDAIAKAEEAGSEHLEEAQIGKYSEENHAEAKDEQKGPGSEMQEESSEQQANGTEHPDADGAEGDAEEDLDDEIAAAVEKAKGEASEGEEDEEEEAMQAPEEGKGGEHAEGTQAQDGSEKRPPQLVPLEALSSSLSPVPIVSPRAAPVLSHTRVKCQDCGSLISVCRRAGDNIVLLKCPVCSSCVAFDHQHSPTIIPYQERTDNFSCHTWNSTQLMVFLQQMGLGYLLPYLVHHNIDGRAMMELFRGELRQRVGLQTEEQTQALLTALNILRLGEGIA